MMHAYYVVNGKTISITVRLRGVVRTHCLGFKPNVLNFNFSRFIYSFLSKRAVTMRTITGSDTLGVDGTRTASYGTGLSATKHVRCTTPFTPDFQTYNCSTACTNVVPADGVSAVVTDTTPMARTVVQSTCNAGGNILVVRFTTTGGVNVEIPIAASSFNITQGNVVEHSVAFSAPFVHNMAAAVAALFADSDVFTATDINGTQFVIEGQSSPVAGAASIAIGTSSTAWSPNDYTLQNMITLTTFIHHFESTYAAETVLYGFYRPTQSITIGEIGIVHKIYEANAGARDVLILRHVITPVTLAAGNTYVFQVRIVVS